MCAWRKSCSAIPTSSWAGWCTAANSAANWGCRPPNIRLQRYRAALEGVFAVTVDAGLDRPYQGIANIGIRPTVDGKEPLLEVHVFDFDEDIYGRLLTVTFKHKIRDERAFESIEALKAQIGYDIEAARAWFRYDRAGNH